MLEDFDVATFAERLGETFRVDDGAHVVELRLVDASPASSTVATPDRRVPFSLLFVGPVEPLLPQRIYRFDNDTLGSFEIFIVPLGPADDGMRYEAVFA